MSDYYREEYYKLEKKYSDLSTELEEAYKRIDAHIEKGNALEQELAKVKKDFAAYTLIKGGAIDAMLDSRKKVIARATRYKDKEIDRLKQELAEAREEIADLKQEWNKCDCGVCNWCNGENYYQLKRKVKELSALKQASKDARVDSPQGVEVEGVITSMAGISFRTKAFMKLAFHFELGQKVVAIVRLKEER